MENNIIQRRPTEFGSGGAGIVIGLLVYFQVIPSDPELIGLIMGGLAFLPGLITRAVLAKNWREFLVPGLSE